MNKYFRFLRILVAIGGCILASASIPIFFTFGMMDSIHRWLGLEALPEQPIVIYLAKSTSLMYAIHGTVLLYVAIYFQRYKHLVPLLGWLHVALGGLLIYIDLAAGMPWWWTIGEGPPVAAVGLLFLWLYGKALRSELHSVQR